MQVLRTPDERFAGLDDFPFDPNYLEVADGEGGRLRLHYVDEGPRDAAPVLLLHGEPTWGYLYRAMIPIIADAGLRVVVPDLPGFGRSDKPAGLQDYSYARHVRWAAEFVERLDLRGVTLLGQDWGGLVGLRLIAQDGDRYARAVATNHGLPTGDRPPTPAFLDWLERSQAMATFPAGAVVAGGCVTELSEAVVAAYDAPYPDETYKAGARIFPVLVPIRADDPAADDQRAAWKVLERWDRPFLTAFSDSDPITAGAERMFQERIPGARGVHHVTIEGAGHNLQEDRGEALAEALVAFVSS